jgi:hypothetical protein
MMRQVSAAFCAIPVPSILGAYLDIRPQDRLKLHQLITNSTNYLRRDHASYRIEKSYDRCRTFHLEKLRCSGAPRIFEGRGIGSGCVGDHSA